MSLVDITSEPTGCVFIGLHPWAVGLTELYVCVPGPRKNAYFLSTDGSLVLRYADYTTSIWRVIR